MTIRARLRRGGVIPAHPLALTSRLTLDERRQRALTRYYLASGAHGLAVGVHTTQFAIHEPKVGLLRPVLELARETARRARPARKQPMMIAGAMGKTAQAVREASLARDLGYDAVLVSLGALPDATDAALIAHLRAIADVLPVMGFYLQPAVGGRRLSYHFWRACVEIENVVAIKVAPFDRYATLDVLRAVHDAGRSRQVALYTGNDDHILLDLLAPVRFGARSRPIRFVGGLLGQWAVWTHTAVRHFDARRRAAARGAAPRALLALAGELTAANAVIFDAANGYRGCLPGIHEVLRRQGLLAGRWCLDRDEVLSPGQGEAIALAARRWPHLTDDAFVRAHRDGWLRP